MHSPILGALETSPYSDAWLQSQPIALGIFPGARVRFRAPVNVMRDFQDAVDKAVVAFLNLPTERHRRFETAAFEYYRRWCLDGGVAPQLATPELVWKSFKPTSVCLLWDEAVYVVVLLDCSWDSEHGVQLSFESGTRLARVSEEGASHRPLRGIDPFSGHAAPVEPAWDD